MEMVKEENDSDKPNNKKVKFQIRHSKTSKLVFKFSQNIKNEDTESEEKIGRKLIKTKSTVKKTPPSNASLTKEDVYRFLSKSPNSRTSQEINIYAKYLSYNFQYFTKLKKEDSQLKVEKLTKVCKLEKTMKGDSIINYGEIGNKFYIVLEGIVEIYKPIYVEVVLSPTEFINKINDIKKIDGTDLRYNRIKNKNKTFFESLNDKNLDSSLVNYMKYKQVFIMEEEEKLGEFKEGFSFGDIALIKKAARNATIKAKENCILLTIEKDDYNKALLEFQKKKLSRDIDSFLKTYTFFKYFNHDKIINLFNCLNTKEIYKGEYLYKQNMQDDSIYFINYGTFSIDCLISFSWINDYINYINYSGKNILQYLLKNKNRKINELLKIVRQCLSQNETNLNKTKEKNDLWEKINEKNLQDNLYKLKKDEEKLNDPEYNFNINLKKIDYNEILGLEEVFEFKKRFCSCKCISEKGEIRSIKITDFLKLIINFGEEEIIYFMHMIDEKKKLLKHQIIKGIRNIEKKLIFNFDKRYENILKSLNLDKNAKEEEKTNMILSTIKMKGYKNSIDDLLDREIPLLENNNKKPYYKTFLKKRKNKSIENIINAYGIKKSTNNEFIFKDTKKSFETDNKTNKEKNKYVNNENLKIDSTYDLINKSKEHKANNISNGNIKRINKISLNSFSNNTLNNSDFYKSSKFKHKRKLNSSAANIVKKNDSINSYDKTNFTNNKSKKFSESTSVKIIKLKNKEINYKIGRNTSVPNFNCINKIKSESFNLPKMAHKNFTIKTNLDDSLNDNKIILFKRNKDYNNFYKFYNEDKNFFLGVDFEKKLKKDSKYNEKPIKNKLLKL